MKIPRIYTTDLKPVEDQIEWKLARASIPGAGFEMDVEVPKHWSLTATNILAQKYLRKAGLREHLQNVPEDNVPEWLHRCAPTALNCKEIGGETSAKQVFHRLAGHWTYVGWKHGYFHTPYKGTSEEQNQLDNANLGIVPGAELNAQAFYDEIYYMLANQIAAPNSPQWFNTGLWWAYGIEGPDSGQWAIDYEAARQNKFEIEFETENSYEYPQPHACFIQPVNDDLVGPGGIMDLAVRESRLFKHGSGTGTNFSNIRAKGEKLSGGGTSSGLMSFLEIGDKAAGAIKSGGTTRRAAKMVCLDLDHPEIEGFINWKVREEAKAAAMNIGSRVLKDESYNRINHPDYFNSEYIPKAIIDRLEQGFEAEEFSCGWEGEAIRTVSGQNSNNSIRVTDQFLEKVDGNQHWDLWPRTGREFPAKVMKAKELWTQICRAAWASADPGVQFHNTINRMNTCSNDGAINASNPCSEYMFLDNTACNLASLNLVRFMDKGARNTGFNTRSFEHATRLWTIVLDISVSMASFPSREIALGSYNYRTLGLGYANVGGLLMRSGIPYDSDEGRSYIAAITAILHGISYRTSNELADELGTFPRWQANREPMAKVLLKHKSAAREIEYFGTAAKLLPAVEKIWNFEANIPYRNAQVTLIAPTGTIALLMDCDTTGIEPEFALRKHKLMIGGGTIETLNQCVWEGLRNLNYPDHTINLITNYLETHQTLEGCRDLKPEHLSVFDCAMPPPGSTRCLSPMAHVEMVAAVQPFLSGAVSKTVNLPREATIEDVDQIYREAHRLGLKSIALYRDGSKLTQPLNTENPDARPDLVSKPSTSDSNSDRGVWIDLDLKSYVDDPYYSQGETGFLPEEDSINKETSLSRCARESLLPRRRGYTQKFKVDGQTIYLKTGEYEDGRLGEIFIDIAREGSALGGYAHAVAMAVSIGLQYGVPLKEFVEAFTHHKFDPAGLVQGHDRIKICSSVLDMIFRDLGITYEGMNELGNIKDESGAISDAIISNMTWDESQVKTIMSVSGEFCSCGGLMIQNGTCKMCQSCGNTNGGCG